jgi:acetyl-CoA/propionyl-CoA carboxylase biotin carboxyl carrier protein
VDRIPEGAWAVAARALDAGGWRLNAAPVARLVADDGLGEIDRSVAVAGAAPAAGEPLAFVRVGDVVHVDDDGRSVAFRVAPPPDVDRAARAAAAHARGGGSADVVAPMPGAVLAVHVAAGQVVDPGDPIATLEAMKMEHAVAATSSGSVVEVRVRPGDQVARGQVLATVEG